MFVRQELSNYRIMSCLEGAWGTQISSRSFYTHTIPSGCACRTFRDADIRNIWPMSRTHFGIPSICKTSEHFCIGTTSILLVDTAALYSVYTTTTLRRIRPHTQSAKRQTSMTKLQIALVLAIFLVSFLWVISSIIKVGFLLIDNVAAKS